MIGFGNLLINKREERINAKEVDKRWTTLGRITGNRIMAIRQELENGPSFARLAK